MVEGGACPSWSCWLKEKKALRNPVALAREALWGSSPPRDSAHDSKGHGGLWGATGNSCRTVRGRLERVIVEAGVGALSRGHV